VKGNPPDASPNWVTTVTVKAPADAIAEAGTDAVIWVALKNVVVSFELLKRMVSVVLNPVPFTVSVNAAPPVTALLGERKVREGAGGACTCMKITFGAPDT